MTSTATDMQQRKARGGRRAPRLQQQLNLMLAVLAGLSLLLFACAATSSASTNTAKGLRAALAYARCMRAHGVTNFPDPDSQGDFPPFHPNVSLQTSKAAQQACQHLLTTTAGGGGAGKDQKKLDFLLKVAQCMRTHGYPTYPDPTNPTDPSQGSGTRFRGTGINTRSARFQTEEASCERQAAKALGIGFPGAN